ncbi:MAG: TVP38/TMEM64 family protein [Dissulfurimicrobium hydrothermale]|uniref:TVP38/TMEM64 family protein n=1 Tax=Dissulfurimicrobium hydrothermale TaxID=1750598 RepID=UPI003C724647
MNPLKKKTLAFVFFVLVSFIGLYVLFSWDWNKIKTFWGNMAYVIEHRDVLRRHVESWGGLAPLAFIALQALQVVFAPLPGEASGIIGGFLFGQWMGFLYSTIGLTAGSMAAFSAARFARRFVRTWLKRSEIYRRFEYLLERQGIFISFALFLIPGFPKDFLCYILGLSRMPWQIFLAVSTIGRMPGTILLTLQGARLYDGDLPGLAVMLFVALVVVLPAWRYREGLYRWAEKHAKDGNGTD